MKCRLLVVFASCFIACGDDGGGDDSAVIDGDPSAVDADPNAPDALGPVNCTPGTTECTDCIDNDNDGRIDGYDIECTGAADDDEGSFATDIPGDNIDAVKQDCFFDGNSGSGDDGCEIHVCCLLNISDPTQCPYMQGGPYDPAECDDPQAQVCLDECLGLVPPGCDCFGCCTVCDPVTNMCYDIITNPVTAPDCNDSVISDPVACPRCVKTTSCEVPCDPDMCILCPGQDPSDLPSYCTGNECPGGAQECTTMECPAGTYCANGCCVSIIE